jgi:hypothetical protein
VLTGNVPFSKSGNLQVMLKVVRGDRPEWPDDDIPFFGFMDVVWRLAEECWDHDRNKRPSIDEVLNRLSTATRSLSPPNFGWMTANHEQVFDVDFLDASSTDDEIPVLNEEEREPPRGEDNGAVYSVTGTIMAEESGYLVG